MAIIIIIIIIITYYNVVLQINAANLYADSAHSLRYNVQNKIITISSTAHNTQSALATLGNCNKDLFLLVVL